MKKGIRRFGGINEFFEATGFERRTDIDEFFIFRFEELPADNALRMSPYQKDFYQVSLILNSGNARADINSQSRNSLENTLYFLSPEHTFSWRRNDQTTGYVVYFKPEFLSVFSGHFMHEFSFFDLSQENFQKPQMEQVEDLCSDFEKLYSAYNGKNPYRLQILQSLLLSFLFKCKSLQQKIDASTDLMPRKKEMVFRFQNLVNNCYIRKKQVADYAQLLHVSPNTLNQYVKDTLGKTAKEVISEKIVQEAVKQLRYTTEDISEVAYSLGYEEPTHFIRFFRKHTSTTPGEYRKSIL